MKILKINKSYLILFCMLLTLFTGWSQLVNANWYFGNHAGLNFENSTTVLNDGQTDSIYKRSASVSDNATGDLLFYVSSGKIWNGNHQIITNSNILGNSFVIIPYPNNSNKYIIFSSVFISHHHYDYYYSVVNVNNGVVSVDSLNNLSNLPYSEFSDNIVVAKHNDNNSFWVISVTDSSTITNSSTISSLLINSTGPTNTVVTTQTSEAIPNFGSLFLSVSSDNSKLAFATYDAGTGSGLMPELYIYNFNDAIGNFSPYIIFGFGNTLLEQYFTRTHSVEFSENSNLLYISGIIENSGGTQYQVIAQMDISDSNNPNITFSQNYNFEFSNTTTKAVGIVRGMDNKIYIPSYVDSDLNYLSVVQSPNNIGASSNFVENQVDLLTNGARKLPYLVLGVSYPCPFSINITQDVPANQADIQYAFSNITASNTINSNALFSSYNAGDSVTLTLGFNAKLGCTFRVYIYECVLPIQNPKGKTNTNSVNNEQLIIFPNPSRNLITIKYNQNFNKYQIFDSKNRILIKKDNFNQVDSKVIDISNFKKGVYLIKVFTQDKVLYSKFIKN